mmetsp:Transcript_36490/g.107768  ORF Transcript_36490/g.107768 Transcript_36490/m.107768 type:complete len:207 (-) Transcript_36490:100-720(-)
MMLRSKIAPSAAPSVRRSAAVRPSMTCHAAGSETVEAPNRRAALLSLLAAPAASAVFAAPAFALLPDEEDEELIEKAKANRKARLEQQRLTTRQFMADEGLKNKELERELEPVQRGVYELAKAGSQVQDGELKAAASTLGGDWLDAFARSAGRFGSPDAVVASIGDLKAATSKGDGKASKRAYVEVVDAVQAWAATASLTDRLQGL